MPKILIIEDDQSIARGLKDNFKVEGYEVVTVSKGEDALTTIAKENPEVVILDVMLPGIDGFEVCRRIRACDSNPPVIMLTAKTEEEDKIFGLGIGADDYITKPFSVQELQARVRALLRRAGMRKKAEIDVYEFDGVQLDFRKYKAQKGGREIYLTRHEFDIMRVLIMNENEPVSRESILEQALGYQQGITTRTIDTHILNLRKKLEKHPAKPKHLLTSHGVGYKFVAGI